MPCTFTLKVGAKSNKEFGQKSSPVAIAQDLLSRRLTRADAFHYTSSPVSATIKPIKDNLCELTISSGAHMLPSEVLEWMGIDHTLVDLEDMTFDGYSYAEEQSAA